MKELRFNLNIQKSNPAFKNWLPIFESWNYVFFVSEPSLPTLPVQSREVQRWCAQEMGERGVRWANDVTGAFTFRDEADAIAFKMRWG